MKAAYDIVERSGLIRMMSKIGIRSDLIQAISDIYAENKSIVQIGKQLDRFGNRESHVCCGRGKH